MDHLILELLGIDRTARDQIEGVKAWSDKQTKEVIEARERSIANLKFERERRVDARRLEFELESIAKRDARIAELDNEASKLLNELEQIYTEHRAEWIDALLDRILKC